MEIVKRPHARNLVRFAQNRPELVVLSADLTSSCEADDFRGAYPDRFFSLGMAEQNMVSFSAGLAREGFVPYIHTFAVFLTRRTFDQVAMSIAYPNLKVRLVGFLPGLTTPGGATHQAIDDVALMRPIPNMTVLECGDATEVETVLEEAHGVNGPVYLRMLRGEVPRLFPGSEPFRIGRARVLRKGGDIAIVSSGISTEEALRACHALASRGVSTTLLHVSTHKPFKDPRILEASAGSKHGVITIENHGIVGGLGSAVAEVLAEAGIGKRLLRLGVRDVYAHGASRPYLLREYGLDARAIVAAAGTLVGEPFDVPDAELSAAPMPDVSRADRSEDL